jgi:hypothetical protein
MGGGGLSTLPVFIGLALLAAAVILVIKIRRRWKKKIKSAVPLAPHRLHNKNSAVMNAGQYLAKGKEIGLSPADCKRLMLLAVSEGLKPPNQFFWSQPQMDIVLKAFMFSLTITNKEDDAANQVMLGRLLEYRKQMSLKKINIRRGLKSTHEIIAGQNVQVILNGVGIFATKVYTNDDCLQVLSPIIHDLPGDFTWKNQKIIVFFRRKNDGEYTFGTTVIEEKKDSRLGEFVLVLRHADTLSRSQKRRSIRTVMQKEAHIYPVDDASTELTESKLCTINDISDTGCSIYMRGNAGKLSSVIIQFMLHNQLINLHGDCKRVLFNRSKGVSLLHIEFAPLPLKQKNQILGFIFGISPGEPAGTPFIPVSEDAADTHDMEDAQPVLQNNLERTAPSTGSETDAGLEAGAEKFDDMFEADSQKAAAQTELAVQSREAAEKLEQSLVNVSFDVFREGKALSSENQGQTPKEAVTSYVNAVKRHS